MSIEAMKQALEALEYVDNNYMSLPKVGNEAITALRQAIAEAEKQEPVAWMNKHGACKTSLFREVEAGAKDEYTIPLYTHSPKREWVGLTLKDMPDDKFGRPEWLDGVNWAEAKLRQKNT